MARVVGVMPPQLAAAGREDAARVLAEILRREGASVSALPPPIPPPPDGFLDAADVAAAVPYVNKINARLVELALTGIAKPSGDEVCGPGTRTARTWDVWADEIERDQLIWLAASLMEREARVQNRGRNTG
jgi:hypothetical protein